MTASQDFLSSLTLLYVEDDPDIRVHMVKFLSRRIGNLVIAENGREGLEQFYAINPDIVVTDIMMPEMDGLVMAKAIRDKSRDIPIVVMTAHNDDEYFIRSIDLGIDRYVLKPTNPRFLIEAVEKCAQLLFSNRQKEEANRYVRFLLDAQPNLLMVITAGCVEYVNHAFLDFLGFSSIDHFNEVVKNAGDLMFNAEGRSINEEGYWLDLLMGTPEKFSIIYLKNQQSEMLVPFALKTNSLPEQNRHLFSFIDITHIENEKRQLETQAFTDALTGVCNRARLQGVLEAELHRARRHNLPISVILGDIDYFKKINDTYGHQVGDDVLRKFAKVLRENVRIEDIVARWGGEEFMVVSPLNDVNATCKLAEKLRRLIENERFPKVGRVTCSFGVSQAKREDSIRTLTERADKALYEAKTQGRNRVEKYM
ncbi:MAG: diguanylate cyclase [Magnetococcales bacterium]|nr:diguanylate cyclase [Magnetococcales bacterium]MBF0150535.1 diguanylate cyclase [Magnetococcales bacterium]MBF0174772.1 diguanylate cyclase [Magnetococcales bacterium]MBF0347176.1 diguanylate cyclase [Magnetococcales bacterium]MBF0631011.1 diguanylate cyclase [Magnetococcales bacterium]